MRDKCGNKIGMSIGEFPDAEPITGAEKVLVLQDGRTRKMDVQDLIGPPGAPGPSGPPGTTGVDYSFPVPALSWTINHNLGWYPSATVFDSGSQAIIATQNNPSLNQTIISFNAPQSGFVRII